MKSARVSRELMALLPWLAAALLWAGLVSPMRADQDLRLRDQARIRRDRVRVERKTREIQSLRGRVATSLDRACRASSDPAALRQRIVGASSGLALSPFSLSVTGGVGAGAAVEAEGAESAIFEFLRRIGDPARGSFLRGVSVRERGGRWSVAAQTGVVDALPAGFGPPLPECGLPVSASPTPTPSPSSPASARVRPVSKPNVPAPAPAPEPTVAPPPPPPVPPFTLVAFLETGGRARVSVRVGDDVRVVSVGDQLSGWRCVSIDRDEGVGFVSASGDRAVLRAAPSAR